MHIGLIILTLLFPLAVANAQNTDQKRAEQLGRFLNERDASSYTYPTKFGVLQFVNQAGQVRTPSSKLLLEGKPLLSVEGSADKRGNEQSLMLDLFTNPAQQTPRKPGQLGNTEVQRMIVSVGPDGNCIKRFIMLDFTGSKPFISKPFGYNPEDRFCLSLKRVKWGKNEIYIDLDGQERYFYRTSREVIGPIGD
jgi:hypothetical protein